ncbi:uncharacterized protein EI90DRAFT_3058056, partial [Cantharellus anzutake]|uniref:uncharacterized protein n=1 Tax=Cantharellus anzutake TaxID=1750568 RepID=UPI0019050D39
MAPFSFSGSMVVRTLEFRDTRFADAGHGWVIFSTYQAWVRLEPGTVSWSGTTQRGHGPCLLGPHESAVIIARRLTESLSARTLRTSLAAGLHSLDDSPFSRRAMRTVLQPGSEPIVAARPEPLHLYAQAPNSAASITDAFSEIQPSTFARDPPSVSTVGFFIHSHVHAVTQCHLR